MALFLLLLVNIENVLKKDFRVMGVEIPFLARKEVKGIEKQDPLRAGSSGGLVERESDRIIPENVADLWRRNWCSGRRDSNTDF